MAYVSIGSMKIYNRDVANTEQYASKTEFYNVCSV